MEVVAMLFLINIESNNQTFNQQNEGTNSADGSYNHVTTKYTNVCVLASNNYGDPVGLWLNYLDSVA